MNADTTRHYLRLLQDLRDAGVRPELALVMLDTGLTEAEINELGGLPA